MTNGGKIQTKKKRNGFIQTVNMSFTPPDAPPYPTSPEDERQDEEASTSAYAEILVCYILFTKENIDLRVF